MVDQLVGLLLLGLGINKSMYLPNANVMGDETQVTNTSQTGSSERPNMFQLNPKNFETRPFGKTASATGLRRSNFDGHAFGKGILRVQTDFSDRLEASREAAKREFEDHKKVFKEELSHIRDTRKQALVDKLNTNCQAVNEKRTEKMTQMLAKLSTLLTNVSNRTASASADGNNMTDVEPAVTAAQTAIADAQAAVAAQAGKTCTITITSETNLKSDVGKTISGMEKDLKAVYTKVYAARRAVGSAIQAFGLATGEPLTKPTP